MTQHGNSNGAGRAPQRCGLTRRHPSCTSEIASLTAEHLLASDLSGHDLEEAFAALSESAKRYYLARVPESPVYQQAFL